MPSLSFIVARPLPWLLAVSLGFAAGCGGVAIVSTSTSGPGDATPPPPDGCRGGSCASKTGCTTTADCANGYECAYEISEACAAIGQCLAVSECYCLDIPTSACGCSGETARLYCCDRRYANEPVAHVGICADGGP